MSNDEDTGSRRPPNEKEIEAGYWLVNYRHNAERIAKSLGYLAAMRVEEARGTQVLKEERGFGMEWSRPLRLIHESHNSTHLVGEAHDGLRQVLRKRGVKGIKNSDLDEFEAQYDFSDLEAYGVEIGQDAKGYYIKCRVGGGCR